MARLLVIEDSRVSQAQLKDILGSQYLLEFREDGRIGAAAARELLPDLILLDIHLPGLDGYDVCRLLKSDEATREIPILFITSLSAEKERVQGFEAGGEDYIVKPFYPDELLARVRVHLESRRSRKQAIELQKLKLLREMAVALSHQINNPLTAVYGCMYILEHEVGDVGDDASASIAGIREGLERIRFIVEKLAHASKVVSTEYCDSVSMLDIENL